MKPSIYSTSQSPELELVSTGETAGRYAESTPPREEAHLRLLGNIQPRPATVAALRALDVVLSGILLLLLWPLFLVIALAVRLDTPGPILFTQMRVGRDGREFPFFKFRSMVADAEAQRKALEALNERNGPVFKMRDDPRITRTGRFIRKFSLDELPQLLNVLRGEMSLVGPRPALPREVAAYTPRQAQRLCVLPGVTGLWQVSGRAEVEFEQSVEMDLTYVKDQSLWLYVKILFLTLPAVLTGRGAY